MRTRGAGWSRDRSQADLVLTPMRATSLDATIGALAVRLVAEEEEVVGRRVAHAVVFTMARAVRSRAHRGIERSLRGQGVDVIEPPLMERAAFADLFGRGGDLYDLPDEGTAANAKENAHGFASAACGAVRRTAPPRRSPGSMRLRRDSDSWNGSLAEGGGRSPRAPARCTRG